MECTDRCYAGCMRPGDTEKDSQHRRILVPAFVIQLGACAAVIMQRRSFDVYIIGMICMAVAASSGVFHVALRLQGRYDLVAAWLVLLTVMGMLLSDLSNASMAKDRTWPLAVLGMDVLVVLNAPQIFQRLTIGVVLFFLAVERTESVAHAGLYELARWNLDEEVAICSCATPPCQTTPARAIVSWWVSIVVFCLDFYVTRSFAVKLRSQLQFAAATERVSERVAELLAAYATDDARRVVAEEGDALPEALRDSYEQLLKNLDSYRVFLPDSLLYTAQQQQQQQRKSVAGDSVSLRSSTRTARSERPRPAPGLGAELPNVAVCFTDIQSSTELWEAHPQGMYEGLNTHNTVMREACAACHGYEVKTIGDSFMVSFDDGSDAVRFGLEAQRGLLEESWPEDLLTHPLCQRQSGAGGEPLWGGLRVRIGVHFGPVRVERNPVTGRCDYFGATVNTAARLENVLRKGGLVAASDAVVSRLGDEGLRELGSPVVRDAGDRELKGVKEKFKVWAIAPQGLSPRLKLLEAPIDSPTPGIFGGTPRPSTASLSVRGSSSGSGKRSRGSSLASLGQGALHSAPIHLRLRQSCATCAVARSALGQISYPADRLPHFIAAATLAADQTQGVVDCVLSAHAVVTWNASRPCADHTSACRGLLSAAFRVTCHLGAASGGVLHGNVAAGRRSFALAAGGCVDFATALAEEAERCADAALATGAVAAEFLSAGAATWAQLWEPPGGRSIVVYDIDVSKKGRKWSFSEMYEDKAADDLGGVSSRATLSGLFERACAAAPGSAAQQAVLSELRELAGEEDTEPAARLAARIERGVVRTRPMPHLWDPDEPRLRAVSVHAVSGLSGSRSAAWSSAA